MGVDETEIINCYNVGTIYTDQSTNNDRPYVGAIVGIEEGRYEDGTLIKQPIKSIKNTYFLENGELKAIGYFDERLSEDNFSYSSLKNSDFRNVSVFRDWEMEKL